MYAALVPYTLLVMTSNYMVMRRLVMPVSFVLVDLYVHSISWWSDGRHSTTYLRRTVPRVRRRPFRFSGFRIRRYVFPFVVPLPYPLLYRPS